MKEWIKSLLELQECDLKIRRLTTRLEMIPIEIQKLESEIESDKAALQKRKEAGMSNELEIKQVESDIMKYNDEIERLQKQSVMVKKNDEYKALMLEIENAQKHISDLETRELELMEEKDEFKRNWKKEEAVTKNKENMLNEEKAELAELETTIKKEIESLQNARKTLCSNISSSSLLDKYTRLLNKGVGQPLVEIHEGNCGNCHLKLTPQTVNSARKGEEVPCENCGHLLYVSSAE